MYASEWDFHFIQKTFEELDQNISLLNLNWRRGSKAMNGSWNKKSKIGGSLLFPIYFIDIV